MDIKILPSESLAYLVLIYKKLKINKDLAIAAMQELEYRNDQGDQFDYNSYIEVEFSKMEKPTEINKLKEKITAVPKLVNAEMPEFIKGLKL